MAVNFKTVRVGSYLLFLTLIFSGCNVIRSNDIVKIALLAPFEGRYREIGYNALYSVQLAMSDQNIQDIHLLAVDDGGSIETAVDRIEALNRDPAVEAIIVLGQSASHPTVQQANDKPLLIVGFWGHTQSDPDTLVATHPDIAEQVTTNAAITIIDLGSQTVGGDLYMLEQMADIHTNQNNLIVLSSSIKPSDEFYQRYIDSDLYVPEPNLLATLTYDVTGLILKAIANQNTPADVSYEGINGNISFSDGYWSNAPIYRYRYVEGGWIQID